MDIQTDIPASVLSLPATYEPPEEGESFESSRPNEAGLKEQQRECYDEMNAFVDGLRKYEPDIPNGYRCLAFVGYAGTGKTWTSTQVVKRLVLKNVAVAFSAPTNKAVKVLRQTAKFKHKLINYRTIHSLLGLKEDKDEETGKIVFRPDTNPDNPPAVHTVKVILLDETSMLNAELFHMLNEAVDKYGVKIIYMGDPCQIPPIGEEQSIPFTPKLRTSYAIRQIEMTEVVRQKQGNPILELATLTRENMGREQIPYCYKTNITELGGIIMINREDKGAMFRVCEHYFTNVRFQHDSDFMKVICWTNKVVNWMNDKIRGIIYRKELNENRLVKIMPGEKLIADSPIFKKDDFSGRNKIIISTSDEMEVEDYTIAEVKVYDQNYIKVYRTKVIVYNTDGDPVTHTVDIVHEDDELKWKAMDQALIDWCMKAPKGPERKQRFVVRYRAAELFANVKYNYALTIHKAQGSTYENCMVIEANIDDNRRVYERNRIKYVAYTRARNLLFIVK